MPEFDQSQRSQITLTGLPIGDELIAAIARHLDLNKVPNVLWGFYLLTVVGVPTIVDGAGFVVPDHDIMAARTVLCNAGLELCVDQECRTVKSRRPPPDEHFHFGKGTCIYLYRQSRTLFNISDLSVSPTHAPSGSDITYASSPSLQTRRPGYTAGAFDPSFYPVRIPTIHCLTEAYLLNFLREVDGLDLSGNDCMPPYASYYLRKLFNLVEYVYKTGSCSLDLLQPRFKDFIETLLTGCDPFIVATKKFVASEKEKGDSRNN